MPWASIVDIPNAVAFDKNSMKDPYAVDTEELPSLPYQRKVGTRVFRCDTGTPELVAVVRLVTCFNPIFVQKCPGRRKWNELDTDAGKKLALAY